MNLIGQLSNQSYRLHELLRRVRWGAGGHAARQERRDVVEVQDRSVLPTSLSAPPRAVTMRDMRAEGLHGAVDEEVLASGLERLAEALHGRRDLVDVFDGFVRAATDDAIVRINPVRLAEDYGCTTASVVDLFLHARKLGLVTMEWQVVCPGCGEIVERLPSLTSASSHFFCQVCSTNRDA